MNMRAWRSTFLLAFAVACSGDGAASRSSPTEGGAGDGGDAAGADGAKGPPAPPCGLEPADVANDGPFAPAGQTAFFEAGLIAPPSSLPCVPIGTGVPQTDCNHHGSSIAQLPDGSMAVAWFHGEAEKSKDSRIVWSKLPPGVTEWTAPEVLYDEPGLAEGNAALFVYDEKTVFLFFSTIFGDAWHEARVRFIRSGDGGATWSGATDLREPWRLNARHEPLRLASGDLLLPVYDESLALPKFFRSSDVFETWEELDDLPLLEHVGQIQPTLFLADDGTVVALTRDGTSRRRIHRMTSDDDGTTWTPSVPTLLPNSGTSVDVKRLANGHVIVVFNDSPDRRFPLAVALSYDDARSFRAVRILPIDCGATSCSLHYPSITQRSDGEIWVSYTHDRKTIGWARFDEAWAAAGTDTASVRCLTGDGERCIGGRCYPYCDGDADCEGGVCRSSVCREPCDSGSAICGDCAGGLAVPASRSECTDAE